MQLVREHLATVISVSAHWATVDWSWPKEWRWCVRANLHFKKQTNHKLGMNGWTFSLNPRKRGKSHHHLTVAIVKNVLKVFLLLIYVYMLKCVCVCVCVCLLGGGVMEINPEYGLEKFNPLCFHFYTKYFAENSLRTLTVFHMIHCNSLFFFSFFFAE